MAKVKVAGIQMACVEEREKNLAKAVTLGRMAAEHGARVICYQQLLSTPWFPRGRDERHFALAEGEDGPTLDALRPLAVETGVTLVCPLFERAADGRLLQHRGGRRARRRAAREIPQGARAGPPPLGGDVLLPARGHRVPRLREPGAALRRPAVLGQLLPRGDAAARAGRRRAGLRPERRGVRHHPQVGDGARRQRHRQQPLRLPRQPRRAARSARISTGAASASTRRASSCCRRAACTTGWCSPTSTRRPCAPSARSGASCATAGRRSTGSRRRGHAPHPPLGRRRRLPARGPRRGDGRRLAPGRLPARERGELPARAARRRIRRAVPDDRPARDVVPARALPGARHLPPPRGALGAHRRGRPDLVQPLCGALRARAARPRGDRAPAPVRARRRRERPGARRSPPRRPPARPPPPLGAPAAAAPAVVARLRSFLRPPFPLRVFEVVDGRIEVSDGAGGSARGIRDQSVGARLQRQRARRSRGRESRGRAGRAPGRPGPGGRRRHARGGAGHGARARRRGRGASRGRCGGRWTTRAFSRSRASCRRASRASRRWPAGPAPPAAPRVSRARSRGPGATRRGPGRSPFGISSPGGAAGRRRAARSPGAAAASPGRGCACRSARAR